MGTLFDTPTKKEIRDDMLRGVSNKRPDWPTGEGSLARAEYGAVAEVAGGLHSHLDVVERSVTPLDANEAGLVQWGKTLEVPRKAGAQASAPQSLLITSGTIGVNVPAGTVFLSAELVAFETVNPDVVDANGNVILDMIASLPGVSGNIVSGEQLSIDVAIPSLASSGTLIRDVTGGTDEELIGAWRERQLSVWRNKRGGGTSADYEQWAEELDFVNSAFIYARKPTISSVGVAALPAALTSAQKAELLALLNERRPVTDDVYLVRLLTRRVDVDIVVTLLPTEVLDWTRPVGGLTALSFDSATRVLTTNEALPSNLGPGDLLTVVEGFTSTTANGEPVRAAAITGTTTLVVAPLTDTSGAPLPFTVPNGAEIYPSSALLADTRRQVINGATLCDDFLLPGIASVGPANPLRRYGPWQSDYIESEISALASVRPEVVTAVTVLGSSGLAAEFAFPNDDQVELLLPGEVVLRG